MRALGSMAGTAILLVGCAKGEGGGASRPAVRDSAGVAIVENRAPAWKTGEGFTVGTTPSLDAGGGDNPDASLALPGAAIRLADGGIAVLDAGTSKIKRYGKDGAFAGDLGRQGSGPGEFQAPIWISRWPGDSFAVYDILGRRFQVFGPDGKYARAETASYSIGPGQPLPPQPQGVFSDGTILARQAIKPEFPFDGPEGSIRQDSARIIRLTLAGQERDTFAIVPSGQATGVRLSFGPQSMMVPINVLLSPQLTVAVHNDTTWVGTGQRWELAGYASDGRLIRLIRLDRPLQDVTAALRDSAREAAAGALSAFRGMPPGMDSVLIKAIQGGPVPEKLPAHGRVMVDDSGWIWVEERPTVISGGPSAGGGTWLVFSPEGAYQGDVKMPESFAPLQIGTDWVLGFWEDEDEVRHVRVHPIERP